MSPPAKSKSALARVVAALSPSCRQATRLQSEAMDRPLSWLEKLGLRVHLLLCKWCRRYGKHLQFLRSAARECDGHPGPEPQRLSAEARERIKHKLLASKDQPGGPTQL